MANIAKNYIEIKSTSVPITFSVLIAKYQVKNKYITIREIYQTKFSKKIKEKRIGESLFYSYCNGSVVPGYSNAEFILNTLKINYTKKQLEELLEVSNDKKTTYNNNRYSSSVSFSLRSICNFIEDEESIEWMLEQRINTTSDGSFSKYVAKLVKQDLDKAFNNEKEESK